MEEMLSALALRGHDVKVVVPAVPGLVTGARLGVDVAAAPYAPRRLQVFGYGRSLGHGGAPTASARIVAPAALASLAARTRSTVRRWRPDAVHLHWVVPQGAIASILPRTLPVVISVHGADVRLAFESGVARRLARLALRRADAVVAASPEMLERVAEIDADAGLRSTVVLHGANSALFDVTDRSKARSRLGLGPAPLVLGVGRFVAKKGFLDLVAALGLVESRDARLALVGDGPLRGDIVSAVERHAPGRVTLPGFVDRTALADWYAAADVVAIPSRHDGNDVDSGPVVLVEALASGRAVVTTPVGMAPAVIVEGENGLLVPEGAAAALARALDAALGDADRLGRGAVRSFSDLGDWDRAAVDLESVYAAATQRRAAS
ncbi:MAG: glycosyltransferase [Acidimicrobiia bacterium]